MIVYVVTYFIDSYDMGVLTGGITGFDHLPPHNLC